MNWYCLILVTLIIAVPVATAPSEAADPLKRGPYNVGVRTEVFVDDSRECALTGEPRTLVTEIWYPATEDADGQVPGLDARAVREWLGRGYLLSAGIADWVATAGGWEAVAPRLQRSLAAAGATAGLDAVLASLTTADDEETPP